MRSIRNLEIRHVNNFFVQLLARLGYGGDPHALCASSLPPEALLLLTGTCAALAVSVLLRSIMDIVVPQGMLQRLAGTRGFTQWAATGTSVVLLAATLEAIGAQTREMIVAWMQAQAPMDRSLTVTGLFATTAGLLVVARAMVFIQMSMFQRRAMPKIAGGMPTDGAFNHAAGLSVGNAGKLLMRPGGGMPAVLAGALLAAYGYELIIRSDVCL
jgi:hypothetical protein